MAEPNKIGDAKLAEIVAKAYAASPYVQFAPIVNEGREVAEFIDNNHYWLREVISIDHDKAKLFGFISADEREWLKGHTRFSDEFIDALAGSEGKRVLYEKVSVVRGRLAVFLSGKFIFDEDEQIKKLIDEEFPGLGNDAALLVPDLLQLYNIRKDWWIRLPVLAGMAGLVDMVQDNRLKDEVKGIIQKYRDTHVIERIEERKKGKQRSSFVMEVGEIGGEFSIPYLIDLLRSLECPIRSKESENISAKCSNGNTVDIVDSFKAIGEHAIKPLLDLSSDRDWKMRVSSVELLETVIGRMEEAERKRNAEKALYRFMDMIDDASEPVAARAFRAVEELANYSLRPLVDKLNDRDLNGRKRKLIASALCHSRPDFTINRERYATAIELLKDPDSSIVSDALTALAPYPYSSIPIQRIITFLLSDDKELKLSTIAFLRTRGEDARNALPFLDRIMRNDEDPKLIDAAKVAIDRILDDVK